MDRRRFLALLGAAPVLAACDPVRGISQVSPGRQGSGDVGDLTGSAQVNVPEDWHNVGGTGEPAFQNSWNTFSGQMKLSFRLRSGGVVDIAGYAVTGGTAGSTVFTLPTGYRPSTQVNFPIVGVSTGTYNAALLTVDTTGDVHPTRIVSSVGAHPAEFYVSGSFFIIPPAAAP